MISRRSREIFAEAARRDLHLALAELPAIFFADSAPEFKSSAGTVTCLRSVMMKPEHADWVPRIFDLLGESFSAG